jgi:hypothetical protein
MLEEADELDDIDVGESGETVSSDSLSADRVKVDEPCATSAEVRVADEEFSKNTQERAKAQYVIPSKLDIAVHPRHKFYVYVISFM